MKRDIKKASKLIDEALVCMKKISSSKNTPEEVKNRIDKIIEAFSIDRDELLRIKKNISNKKEN